MAVADTALDSFSFTPDYLSIDVLDESTGSPGKATLKSGLGMQFGHELLDFSIDYRIRGEFREAGEATVSQRARTSLRSSTLNELLGLDADITAAGEIRDSGAYAYSVTPKATRTIAKLGDIDVQYIYLRDRKGTKALEQQKLGYRMGLKGGILDGRMSWKGHYQSTDVSGGQEPLHRLELVELEWRYRLLPGLHVQASGLSKDKTLIHETGENDLYGETLGETRYGIGLSWSPSPYYSVDFKVNRLDGSRDGSGELFGSSAFSWRPQPNMALSFSYGDYMVEGQRGFMFSTTVDLNSG